MVIAEQTSTSRTRRIADLPGPRGLPFVGNALQVRPNVLHTVIERWSRRYGPVYSLRLFGRRVVVFSDPAAIERALHERPATFRRMPRIQDVAREIGFDGVFSAEGETWRRQRQIVARALDANHVREFFPTLRTITTRLKRRWDRAAAARESIDLYGELSRYTVDVTTNFAFGYDMNTLERDDDVMQYHLSRMFPIVNVRVNVPFSYWHYVKLPIDRTMDRAVAFVRARVGEIVEASRKRMLEEPPAASRAKNLMEALLSQERDGKNRLSPDEFFANLMTMLLAGEDTTAATLAWALHLIARHPDVQMRLRAEAEAVLGGDDVVATIEDVGRLTYHDAVISETMRLKPVVPLFFMQANVATELGGVALPAGTLFFLATRVAGLASPGAAEFAPERWLAREGASNEPKDFAFGAGPRFCPGRSLAVIEMKTALSAIVRNFTILPDPQRREVREAYAFVMLPRDARIRLQASRA